MELVGDFNIKTNFFLFRGLMRPTIMDDSEVLPVTQHSEIEQRVEAILTQKKTNPAADVSELEEEINQIVYKLYGLTEDEIAIVERYLRILV